MSRSSPSRSTSALPMGTLLERRGKSHPQTPAPGVPEGDGTRVLHRGEEHVPQFIFVLGGHHHQVGQVAQIGQVEEPLVGLAVFAHDAGPVQGKDHRQLLQQMSWSTWS